MGLFRPVAGQLKNVIEGHQFYRPLTLLIEKQLFPGLYLLRNVACAGVKNSWWFATFRFRIPRDGLTSADVQQWKA